MIQLRVYAGLSTLAALVVIYHAFSSRGQFYPATVYLSTSKINLVVLLNMGLVLMLSLWNLVKIVFLGSLREAEVERLNEQAWRELMEILFAITIFRQDFSVGFISLVVTLLLIKGLHWMAQKRVEYIETTPSVTLLSHVRIVSFMVFLLLLDGLLTYSSIRQLIQSRKASMSVFFTFENLMPAFKHKRYMKHLSKIAEYMGEGRRYMILATTTVSIIVKYAFYVTDILKEGQWEGKPVYTFYLELVRDLLHLSMYLCFFLMIFMNYGLPLHLIRELYETFRNFKIRVTDYLRYRKITSNMNERFPDATPEELSVNDATCIICREEMTSAKKLVCGHLFHVHCLRSWLERQNTCPTCRALVVPAENATSTASGNRGPHQESLQQGIGTSSSDGQGSSVSAAASENMSRHEARFQAAASAASIYGRSVVYPSSANTLVWSQGCSLLPQTELEAQRRFLESQIEVLQNQLRLLEKPATVDTKGKSVAETAE
ncbi:hypothetical protein ARALYDRAFT_315468 [Arabidopsis lyrata subsp. lyrata]|uniref:RING-type E3 ubiquitin transferase n=1 Tax=Arabidopsis lyrata subsp. lyrata TaxID=81972 RepID=D7KZ48_ARALL|nr:hypothetical protein ARALYDRAFT_315468 [Arabidopsis lyrata subsp. lyrata]